MSVYKMWLRHDDVALNPQEHPPITWPYHSVPVNHSVWCHRSDSTLWWHHLHRSITAAARVSLLVHMRSPLIAVVNGSMCSHAVRILGRVMDLAWRSQSHRRRWRRANGVEHGRSKTWNYTQTVFIHSTCSLNDLLFITFILFHILVL